MRITASIVTHRTDVRELRRCTECVLRCKSLTRLDIIDNSPDDVLRSAVREKAAGFAPRRQQRACALPPR